MATVTSLDRFQAQALWGIPDHRSFLREPCVAMTPEQFGNSHTVGLCLETIWNYKNSNTEGYRAVGANLAAAVREYLAERPVKQ